jgi:photosystem II stability/assembly factor-like uncharacterized protein
MALFKSVDGALNWTELVGWRTGDPFVSIWCVDLPDSLVIDPRDPNTLYIATCPAGGGFFKSTDGGVTATALSSGPYFGPLAIDVTGTVYAINGSLGVLKSTDRGESWNPVNAGLPVEHGVTVLAIDPLNPDMIYAGTAGSGVFRSTNAGTSWSAVNSGLATSSINTLALDPRDTSTIYAGTNRGVFAATFVP